jgi:hypothetical protein
MANNREMLKEAIAEAKAVKNMAIANAKAALEESFSPQLQSMLSLKLQEMDMEDDMMEMKDDMMEMEDDMMEIDLEELLAELENDSLNEGEEDEEEEEEDMEMEDLSDEELKAAIEEVIAQMIKSGELEAGSEFEAEEDEEMEMSDEEEDVDLAELLREIEEMEEAENSGVPSAEEIKAAANKLKAAADSGELSQEDLASLESAADAVDVNAINEAEGENLKAEFQAEVEKLKKDRKVLNVAQKIGIGVASLSFALLAYGISQDADTATTARAFEMLNINPSVVAGIIGSIGGVLGTLGITGKKYSAGQQIKGKEYQMSKMEEDLSEALSTIKTLKSELNEINLLNAKLLYTNKIFKAKNLNESQKVKVLSSFDKAKNVSEVKIVFETLNEGIKTAKSPIKENLGRASKSTNTTTKRPILESNDAFKRMQKLAGLI